VGRTGSFIVVDAVLDGMKREQKVDIQRNSISHSLHTRSSYASKRPSLNPVLSGNSVHSTSAFSAHSISSGSVQSVSTDGRKISSNERLPTIFSASPAAVEAVPHLPGLVAFMENKDEEDRMELDPPLAEGGKGGPQQTLNDRFGTFRDVRKGSLDSSSDFPGFGRPGLFSMNSGSTQDDDACVCFLVVWLSQIVSSHCVSHSPMLLSVSYPDV
jgi:hypothetical protein